jgi:hypothetical protein
MVKITAMFGKDNNEIESMAVVRIAHAVFCNCLDLTKVAIK